MRIMMNERNKAEGKGATLTNKTKKQLRKLCRCGNEGPHAH